MSKQSEMIRLTKELQSSLGSMRLWIRRGERCDREIAQIKRDKEKITKEFRDLVGAEEYDKAEKHFDKLNSDNEDTFKEDIMGLIKGLREKIMDNGISMDKEGNITAETLKTGTFEGENPSRGILAMGSGKSRQELGDLLRNLKELNEEKNDIKDSRTDKSRLVEAHFRNNGRSTDVEFSVDVRTLIEVSDVKRAVSEIEEHLRANKSIDQDGVREYLDESFERYMNDRRDYLDCKGKYSV